MTASVSADPIPIRDVLASTSSGTRDATPCRSFSANSGSIALSPSGTASVVAWRCLHQPLVEERTRDGIRVAEKVFAQPDQFERLRKYHGDKAEWALNAWVGTWLSPDFAGWSLDLDLPHVRCPVLAIHGEDDEYGSVAHPRRIASLVAGPATVEIIPGCGHVPHRECEGHLVDRVCAFLDGHPPSNQLLTERVQS
jgi:pimeloyl-ACP methyl ester carboxylesterase